LIKSQGPTVIRRFVTGCRTLNDQQGWIPIKRPAPALLINRPAGYFRLNEKLIVEPSFRPMP
jgi:hypothetical protein